MAAEEDYLFVYGTLRKAGSPQALALLSQYCDYHAEAWVQGRLYEVAGYPGLVDSACPSDRVLGELYHVGGRLSVLAALDDYEECSDHFPQPHEYIRCRRPVSLIDGAVVQAWIYLYNRDVGELSSIPSGDYTAFLASSGDL
ncbi:gamma-glutamylcyclotransferase family protein [Allohahella sp. A8]|uniref:gamma-glutamylcyclotransferase family protein n=1 Tax=Allohahella sp. A8 TaxID=3141461 RepID=UPI003A80540D